MGREERISSIVHKESFVCAIKKWLCLCGVLFCGLFLFPLTLQAADLLLEDRGNGFLLPKTFDLKASDGSFLKSPKLDPALFAPGTRGEEEELKLENGFVARKTWTSSGDDEGAYPTISVYDADGNEVYRAGRDACGELVVFLKDQEGNTLLSKYTSVETRYEDGQCYYDHMDEADPIDMEQYDAGENVTHHEHYTRSSDASTGEELPPIINAFDTYWDENGAMKNSQLIVNGQVASTWDGTVEMEFDDFVYELKDPVNLTKKEWKILEPCFEEGDHHICPSYTSAMAGQPLIPVKVIMVNDDGEERESIMYFTDAHNQIMEDDEVMVRRHVEGVGDEMVIYYDVIKKKCPLYLYDELLASTELMEVRSPEAEAMFAKQEELEKKKREAVIRGSDRQTAAAPETESTDDGKGSTYSERDGESVWNQKIVGDVVPINGKVPTTLETWEHDGHVLLTLRDDDGNIVQSADLGSDKSHTEYQYVYFTDLSLLDNGMVVFMVAGTDDAGMSGNMNQINQGTTDTDQGSTGITTYYQN